MGTNYQKRPQTFATNVTVGKTLTVSSAATIARTLTASSGATITKTLTASSQTTLTKAVSFSSAATITRTLTLSSHRDEPIQTATTAQALTVGGISTISRKSSAGASTNLYTLAGAAAGTYKEILCIHAGSTRTARVTLGSGVSFYSSASSTDATLRKATFNAGKEGLLLRAVTTAKYFIVSNLNSVAIATT